MQTDFDHIPVLKEHVMNLLAPAAGERILDVTLGLGGHAGMLLEAAGPSGKLIALDADTENIRIAEERLKEWKKQMTIHHLNFAQIGELQLEPMSIDIVFADIGLSSPHLDDASRGFSFRSNAPLDMRFDRTKGETASELIKRSEPDDLNQIFRMYGELWKEASKLSRLLAGKDIATTDELKKAVENGFGFRAKPLMPQVFQALRIAVNDELRALGVLLAAGPLLLKPGGRMGVISFHSLEDRMVKQAFRALCEPIKDEYTGKIAELAPFEPLTKKASQADEDEIARNPRSRSAKFRAIKRRTM